MIPALHILALRDYYNPNTKSKPAEEEAFGENEVATRSLKRPVPWLLKPVLA